jgi:hypothetical protein
VGLELPAELKWLEWVVGTDWPQGDEDALWRVRDAWHAAARDVESLLGDGDSAYYRVLGGVGGSLEEAFTAYWQQYSDGDEAYLTKLSKLCDNLAAHCDQTAMQIEYAKYQFIVALIILAIQITYMLAMAGPSFGASTAGIPVAQVATQSFIRMIAMNVIRTMIFMILQNVLSDVVVQAIQLGEGHRAHFDASKTVEAAMRGAVSGAAFGLTGGLIHVPLGKLAPNLSKTLLGRLGEGAVINAAGSVTLSVATGEPLTLDGLAKSATAGMTLGAFGKAHGQIGDSPLGSVDADLPVGGHDLFAGTGDHPSTFEAGGPHPMSDRPSAGEPPSATSSSERIFSVLSGGHDPLVHGDPVVADPVRPDPVSYTEPGGPRDYGTAPVDPAFRSDPPPGYHDQVGYQDPAGLRDPSGPRDSSGYQDPPAAYRDPGGFQDPAAYRDPGGYQDPAAYRDPGGFQDPAAYRDPAGYQDPAAYRDPAANRDTTGLAGAQSAGVVDAPPGTAYRPEPIPTDPAQRGPAAPTGPAFVGPMTAPMHEAPAAGSYRAEPTAPTTPRPRVEPTYGYEPRHSTVDPDRYHADPDPGVRPERVETGAPPGHDGEFAHRGDHPEDVAWRYEKDPDLTLTHEQNREADRFLAGARDAEPAITPRVRDLAHDVGGHLEGEDAALKGEESFKRKLADEIDEYPYLSLSEHMAEMKDAVRYSVVFDGDHYTEGAQRFVDHMLGARDENGEPRFEPVKFKNKWNEAEGFVGINSFWRDRATGQVFEVQIHTPESYRTTIETHPLLEIARDSTDPQVKAAMQAATNLEYGKVARPTGAGVVHIPDHAWPDGHPPEPRPAPAEHHAGPDTIDRGDHSADFMDHSQPVGPFVTDAEAVQIARDNLHQTPSGYAFYPNGDKMLPYAQGVHAQPGRVVLDLHGSVRGFHIDGKILTGEQFARAIDVLQQEGKIHLDPGDHIRLLSCRVGRGVDSPAEQFARASGREVTAPTELMWTDRQGTEFVSSRTLVNGRWEMTQPPDGHWRTFGPTGEINPGTPGQPAPGQPGPGHAAPGQPTPGQTRMVDASSFMSRDDPPHQDQHDDQQHHDQQHEQHEHHDDPASHSDHPEWTDDNLGWDDVRDALPSDNSGYRITPHDCEFLGIDPAEAYHWSTREAPLGMSPEDFTQFREGMYDGLHADGFSPEQVDVRLQGSSARFFSGEHKTMPTLDEITDPEAQRRYEQWRGDATEHPQRRPFDSMYQLHLDRKPSDYDVQVSSDAMLAHAEAVRREQFPRSPLLNRDYGFISKRVAQRAFPGLYAWAAAESRRLGREVVPAVFPGSGPPDNTATGGTSSHFRDTDWRIEPPGED